MWIWDSGGKIRGRSEGVAKIGLGGYIQYESHVEISILVRRVQKLPRPMDNTHKNSGNVYKTWIPYTG